MVSVATTRRVVALGVGGQEALAEDLHAHVGGQQPLAAHQVDRHRELAVGDAGVGHAGVPPGTSSTTRSSSRSAAILAISASAVRSSSSGSWASRAAARGDDRVGRVLARAHDEGEAEALAVGGGQREEARVLRRGQAVQPRGGLLARGLRRQRPRRSPPCPPGRDGPDQRQPGRVAARSTTATIARVQRGDRAERAPVPGRGGDPRRVLEDAAEARHEGVAVQRGRVVDAQSPVAGSATRPRGPGGSCVIDSRRLQRWRRRLGAVDSRPSPATRWSGAARPGPATSHRKDTFLTVLRPRTLDDALAARAAHPDGDGGGGWDRRARRAQQRRDRPGGADRPLARRPSCARRDRDGGVVRLGATITYTDVLERHADAARPRRRRPHVASRQIRNRATLAGALVLADPSGDALAALGAAGARGRGRARAAPRGASTPWRSSRRPAAATWRPTSWSTALHVPVADGPVAYAKAGARNAMARAVCGVAVALHPARRGGERLRRRRRADRDPARRRRGSSSPRLGRARDPATAHALRRARRRRGRPDPRRARQRRLPPPCRGRPRAARAAPRVAALEETAA